MVFLLSSPAVVANAAIPVEYTCDGANLSPALEWRGVPDGTKSFVIIVEDPDAPVGMFRHWAVYNIPGTQTSLPKGFGSHAVPPEVGQGVNDFGHARYDGPCPPKGHGVHHYHFRVGAVDVATLTLPADTKVAAVWQAAAPHMLAETELVGTYLRP